MTDVAFSDDGDLVAISSLYSSSGHPDPAGAVHVFDFKTPSIEHPIFARQVPAGGVAFVGKDAVALVGRDVEVLNLKTGEAVVLLKNAPYRPHWKRTPISVSRDGNLIACVGRVFDVQTRNVAFEMDEHNGNAVEADAAISGNGEVVAVLSRKGERRQLAAYDRRTKKLLASVDVGQSLKRFLKVSDTGDRVWWAGGTLDVKSGKADLLPRGEIQGVWVDGTSLVVMTSHYSDFIELFSPVDRKTHRIIDPGGKDQWFASLSPDCRYVAVVSGGDGAPKNDQLEVWKREDPPANQSKRAGAGSGE